MKFFYLSIGGAIGTISRFLLFTFINNISGQGVFPWGTFSVNLIGSFLIGLLAGIYEQNLLSFETKLFIFTGLIGGFTTFSALALEGLNLFRSGNYLFALSYLIGSSVFGILLAALGFLLFASTSSKNKAISQEPVSISESYGGKPYCFTNRFIF